MKRGFLNGKKAKNQLHTTLAQLDTRPCKVLEHTVIIHFPSPELTQSKERSSTCVFRPSTCDKIMRTPGFYTALPPPLNPTDVVFMKNVPNMGVGLFSKRSVQTSQVVFSERPLLVYPLGVWTGISDNLSKEEEIKRGRLRSEEMLQLALSKMTKEDVDAYMSLSNCHSDFPSLYGIAATNAFGTGTDIDEAAEGEQPYGAIGKLVSRINHSCMPNVQIRFDIPTFSLQVITLRDVTAGEQLFHCYRGMYQSVEERRRQLAAYDFECQCKACVDATPESDRLRKEMGDRNHKVLSLDSLLELEREIVKEGLGFGEKFASLIYAILEVYVKRKNRPKCIEYSNKWKTLTQ